MRATAVGILLLSGCGGTQQSPPADAPIEFHTVTTTPAASKIESADPGAAESNVAEPTATSPSSAPATPAAPASETEYIIGHKCTDRAVTLERVTGTAVKHCAYGPPGYGEEPQTDSREDSILLVLDEPIAELRVGNGDDATCIDNVTMFHIATFEKRPKVPQPVDLAQQHFTLIIKDLHHAETAHHQTRVMLWYDAVTDTKPAPKLSLKQTWERLKHDYISTSCKGYPR